MQSVPDKNIISKESFSKKVEKYVEQYNSTYMDAVIGLCETYGIDYDNVTKILNRPILEHIKEEGKEQNLLPRILLKTKKLPF